MTMGKLKTQKEVDAEVEKLREMKPFVRQFTSFGDDNHARIEAEIQAILQFWIDSH